MYAVLYELTDGVTQNSFGPFNTFKDAYEALEKIAIQLQADMKEFRWIQIERLEA